MSVIISGTEGLTFNDASLQGAAASPYVLKNRIINGDMRIDQRNAGASVNAVNNTYCLDRWNTLSSLGSTYYSVQQNAGSVTPPDGFINYLGVTSLGSYSVSGTDSFALRQAVEGFNSADLGWGTANAKTVTLSFWVRSSLTGTFGGAFSNAALDRSYPFSYSIPSANTWTQISVTVAGDTSGTWGTTNTTGIWVFFGLGMGSTLSGTVGSWSGNSYRSATGAVSVVGTNGATFYITGVQLEQNTSATPFERRLYNQELANCQRYFEVKDYGTNTFRLGVVYQNGAGANGYQEFVVTKRATPSISWTSNGSGRFVQASTAGIVNTSATIFAQTISTYGTSISTTNTYNNGIGWLDQYGTMQISAEL